MQFKLKNFDIDKFNRDVNASGGPDVQYERWSEYRTKIPAFIEGSLENAPDANSAAVFGAGNLNDLDMRFLCGKFEKIALSDADTRSIEEGLTRQGLSEEEKAKIKIVQADYTGAQKAGLFPGLERLARRAAPADELAGSIEKAMLEMEPDAPAERFDIVISCPVYTQLVYTQIEVFLKILNEYGLYEYHELNKILNAAYNVMPRILEKYNDLLISACKENGHIILFTDVIEMKKKSMLLKKTYKLMEAEHIDYVKIEKHVKKHGIEITRMGLEDFVLKTDKTAFFYEIWPFGEGKEYLVYGVHTKIAIV